MKCRARTQRFLPVVTIAACLSMAHLTIGCRTTTDDVHRWANTAQGPRKLVAVVVHDKYPIELRLESAMTLIGMKPRAGRRVGIDELLNALNQMPEERRAEIITPLVPKLVEEIGKAPTGEGENRVDTSVPYKDAAYALLTNDGNPLVKDQGQVAALEGALAQWAVADFANRMDDSSQKYGMEQVLRHLGAAGMTGLPALIVPDGSKTDRIADLIADLADEKTKLEASKRLVAVAKEVDSQAWIDKKAPGVRAANKASKLEPTKEQFEKQLESYQEEELLRVFASMKKVGKAPIVEYLLDLAANDKKSDKQRAAALAALEGHLDKDNKSQVERILKLAGGEDTPNAVRDVALRRVGEMPRQLVADRLYSLFRNDNWKIRWVAAELILKMSDQSHLDEFMRRLGNVKGMAITEPLRYGKLIGNLKGKAKPEEIVDAYARSGNPMPIRLSALGYYYEMGNESDLPKVARYESDRGSVPECSADAEDCEWKCTIGTGKSQEVKEIETLGEFAKYCVEPAMKKRKEKPETEKGDKRGKESGQ